MDVIRKFTVTILVLLLVLVSPDSAAQSNAVGFVYGQVQTPTGEPVTGASIELVNVDTGSRRVTTANADGSFRFASVVVGDYVIEASAEDVATGMSGNFRVNLGKGRGVELTLGVDEIEVVGRRFSRVDVSDTETSTTITKATIERIPVGINPTSVALLSPGTLQGDSSFGFLASFGGASVSENAYYINGMNITDFRNGLGFSWVPFQFFEEFEVKTGGFSAEFGRSTGGVINAVSKSGGNEFEFSGGIIYSPHEWDANEPDVFLPDGTLDTNNKEDQSDQLRRYFEVSGPIVKNRAFFHVLYSPEEYKSKSFSINSARFSENDYPNWAAKLDFWLTQKHLLEVTAFSDRGEGRQESFAYDVETGELGDSRGITKSEFGGDHGIIRYSGFLTPSFTISALAGFDDDAYKDVSPLDANPVIIDFRVDPPADLGNWSNFRATRRQDDREVYRLDLEWQVGNHDIKAGLDRETNTSVDTSDYSGGVFWVLEDVAPGFPLNDGAGSVVPPGVFEAALEILFRTGGSFEVVSSAFYLQDTWAVTDDLTLSIGLRNEQFKNKNANGKTFIEVDEQWAPRLGFAWDISGLGRSKLFATAGRYHLPLPSIINIRLAGGDYYSEQWFELEGLNSDDTPILGQRLGGAVFADGLVPDTRLTVDESIDPMYQDEYILGYVTEVGDNAEAGVRAIYRDLAESIEDIEISQDLNAYAAANGFDTFFAFPFSRYILTNPGSDLSTYADLDNDGSLDPVELSGEFLNRPRAKRTYKALELFYERRWQDGWMYNVSYTLAESRGNHEGYVKSDNGQRDPAFTLNFDYPGLSDGADGPLPNDRRHSLKAWGAWEFRPGWQLGASARYVSGRPINSFGTHPTDPFAAAYGASSFFTDGEPTPRGSLGRTPSVTDIDLSLQYRRTFDNGAHLRVMFEVFNVLNADNVYEIDEYSETFFGAPNPAFGLPANFQNPRGGRLSLHFGF